MTLSDQNRALVEREWPQLYALLWGKNEVRLDALLNAARSESSRRIEELEREVKRRDAVARDAWGDQEDEHTAAISAAHPMRTKDHATFEAALAMVGKRHGKYELVGLVNWLLGRTNAAEAKLKTAVEALEKGVGLADWMLGRRPDAFTKETIELVVTPFREVLRSIREGA